MAQFWNLLSLSLPRSTFPAPNPYNLRLRSVRALAATQPPHFSCLSLSLSPSLSLSNILFLSLALLLSPSHFLSLRHPITAIPDLLSLASQPPHAPATGLRQCWPHWTKLGGLPLAITTVCVAHVGGLRLPMSSAFLRPFFTVILIVNKFLLTFSS